MSRLNVVSLFSGAGGLDLGLEQAGFTVRLCVESDDCARKTLEKNRPRWALAEPGDIHGSAPRDLLRQASLTGAEVTLLAAGPPCQPFSKSGYWSRGESLRLRDPRSDTLRSYLRFVEATLPRVLLLENVTGLVFKGKDEGLQLLKAGVDAINRRRRSKYEFAVLRLNAAAYGVPQLRERVFLIAEISGKLLQTPSRTHGGGNGSEPYLTAWDAIGHLDQPTWPPDLDPKGRWARLLCSIPEGQNYLWHTPRNRASGGEPLFGWRTRYWSFLLKLAKNRPSWTIQADPGPATGPFHWRNRLLSAEEMCRLQTFPEGYTVEGMNRRSTQRQLGNAVPSALGELLGLEIRRQLLGETIRHSLRLIPRRRVDCPPPEIPHAVPRNYLPFRAAYRDHPGPGRGPGAAVTHRTGGEANALK